MTCASMRPVSRPKAKTTAANHSTTAASEGCFFVVIAVLFLFLLKVH